MLSVLCRPTDRAALLGLLLRETSTFGVRVRDVTRYATAREARPVTTPFGAVQVKLKILDGAVAGAAPEYEDCRRLAAACGVPLPQVYAAALAAAAPLLGASAVTS
jgi:pyridinium-3,5-bisthiocarboxylic acid mononucleotide nickel chelatase